MAGHVGGLLQTHDVEDAGGHVGQDAVLDLGALVLRDVDEGHGVEAVGGIGCAVGVEGVVGVAVVSDDDDLVVTCGLGGLHDFLEALKKVDEPTLVFFVGDHFPSLRGETSVYNELGLNGQNCDILYEQKYFYWANYDADFSVVPKDKYSFFYVPYVIFNIIDAPHDSFIEKMMSYLKSTPIYSTAYNADIPENDDLNMLTYDRVVGSIYSTSPLDDD